MAHVTVLDVGHGNAAVVAGPDGVVVIDAPEGQTLLAHLRDARIRVVDALLISHADSDHVGGATNLLVAADIEIRTVYLNTEALRDTKRWRTLLSALSEAYERGETDVQPALTTSTTWPTWAEFSLSVLSPLPVPALTGAGVPDHSGHVPTANEMSAVVKVSGPGASVLLASDCDSDALPTVIARDPQATVLVFPHHGGLPGKGDPYAFARTVVDAVKPAIVVFSLGRGMHDTPQPEIVRGVRDAAPDAHIACTQLSRRCAAAIARPPGHILAFPASGRDTGTCCAGSMQFDLSAPPAIDPAFQVGHQVFVNAVAESALCRRT